MLRPSSAEAFSQLGVALAKKGDRQGAIDAFKRALELDPESALARESLDKILKPVGEVVLPGARRP